MAKRNNNRLKRYEKERHTIVAAFEPANVRNTAHRSRNNER